MFIGRTMVFLGSLVYSARSHSSHKGTFICEWMPHMFVCVCGGVLMTIILFMTVCLIQPCCLSIYLSGCFLAVQFSSVQLLSHVQFFVTPWTAARQASLSVTNSWSLPRFMSIDSVMPSNHLILCHPLLLPTSIFPSIEVFSNESALPIR